MTSSEEKVQERWKDTIPQYVHQTPPQRVWTPPCPLSTSSRGLGFAVHAAYRRLCDGGASRCSVHQLYRVSLAQFTLQLSEARSGGAVRAHPSSRWTPVVMETEHVLSLRSSPANVSSVANLVNSVGTFRYNGVDYVPVQCDSMPFYMRLNFYNLRSFVELLSDVATPLSKRLDNYRHNPIPGADWGNDPDNPLLLNADHIIPPGYDGLLTDVRAVAAMVSSLPELHRGVVDLDGRGSCSQIPGCLNLDVALPALDVDVTGVDPVTIYSNAVVPRRSMSHAAFLLAGESEVDDAGRQPAWTTRHLLTAVAFVQTEFGWISGDSPKMFEDSKRASCSSPGLQEGMPVSQMSAKSSGGVAADRISARTSEELHGYWKTSHMSAELRENQKASHTLVKQDAGKTSSGSQQMDLEPEMETYGVSTELENETSTPTVSTMAEVSVISVDGEDDTEASEILTEVGDLMTASEAGDEEAASPETSVQPQQDSETTQLLAQLRDDTETSDSSGDFEYESDYWDSSDEKKEALQMSARPESCSVRSELQSGNVVTHVSRKMQVASGTQHVAKVLRTAQHTTCYFFLAPKLQHLVSPRRDRPGKTRVGDLTLNNQWFLVPETLQAPAWTNQRVCCITYCEEFDLLGTATSYGKVGVWEANSGQLLDVFQQQHRVECFCFGGQNCLALGHSDGSLEVRQKDKNGKWGLSKWTKHLHTKPWALIASCARQLLACCARYEGKLFLFDLDSGQQLYSEKHPRSVPSYFVKMQLVADVRPTHLVLAVDSTLELLTWFGRPSNLSPRRKHLRTRPGCQGFALHGTCLTYRDSREDDVPCFKTIDFQSGQLYNVYIPWSKGLAPLITTFGHKFLVGIPRERGGDHGNIWAANLETGGKIMQISHIGVDPCNLYARASAWDDQSGCWRLGQVMLVYVDLKDHLVKVMRVNHSELCQ